MDDLSNDARAVMVSMFMSPTTTLTMHNQKSILSPRARAAMNELILVGLLSVTYDRGAEIFQQTEVGKSFDRRKAVKGDVFAWMKKHASFPIAVPKEARHD